jgi:hypothetical protein
MVFIPWSFPPGKEWGLDSTHNTPVRLWLLLTWDILDHIFREELGSL